MLACPTHAEIMRTILYHTAYLQGPSGRHNLVVAVVVVVEVCSSSHHLAGANKTEGRLMVENAQGNRNP